jgi:signal transduction histidine kinase
MDIKPVAIDELISNSIERLQTRYKNLNLKVDLGGKGILARVDARRLGQVFDNLVSNAAKYAPNSAVIFSVIPEGKKVHILIADNGPGIPEQHLEHIFNRFYRVPERSAGVRGTGLGLFICNQIVRAHHGEIKVESKLDKGTAFHIYLPVLKLAKTEVKK